MPDDTNRRVAEACGIEYRKQRYFKPLKNTEHAVLAAETFGLFNGEGPTCRLLFWSKELWEVLDADGRLIGSGTF